MSSSAESQTAAPSAPARTRASRWVVLGSVLLIVAGAINLLNGYAMIEHHSYFRTNIPIQGGLTGWGWAFVVWGGVQLLAGLLAWRGHISGNAIGVGVCALAAMIWFLLVFAAPWAALAGIAVNVAIIFALTAGGWPGAEY